LTLEYQSDGNKGKGLLVARINGNPIYTDKVDLTDASGRERFLRGLTKGRKGINRKTVASELERIAGEIVGDGRKNDNKRRRSQADVLVDLAAVAELFHTPGGHDSEGYATVPVGDHKETWPISSKGFRRWLSRLYYLNLGKAPGTQALQDAINVLAGIAIHDGPEIPIAVRVAEQPGAIYLDLADPHWRAVEVTAAGWRIIENPPVRFCRRRGMLALPVPVAGGRVDELRSLVNVPDDDAWRLLIAWLIAALRPGRPFPVLVVNGEQGSAKSTLWRMARALIDPNESPLRRPPREDRDLMIAASNAWIVAFDNLSGLHANLSDALCSLATGAGFATRELYTDGDEKLFSSTRPMMVNGIEELATRSDPQDRSIILTLPIISDEDRQEEESLWERFREVQPRIQGALLDAVAAALANKDKTKLTSKPRMADFAAWVVAAESTLGWSSGSFLASYLDNRATANTAALDESVLVPLLLKFLDGRGNWQGTAGVLLTELESLADEKTRRRRDWPSNPRKLSRDLRRLAPNLRRGVDLEVQFKRDPSKARRRLVCLDWEGKRPNRPIPSAKPPQRRTVGRLRAVRTILCVPNLTLLTPMGRSASGQPDPARTSPFGRTDGKCPRWEASDPRTAPGRPSGRSAFSPQGRSHRRPDPGIPDPSRPAWRLVFPLG
jgi:hypothetical protein